MIQDIPSFYEIKHKVKYWKSIVNISTGKILEHNLSKVLEHEKEARSAENQILIMLLAFILFYLKHVLSM